MTEVETPLDVEAQKDAKNLDRGKSGVLDSHTDPFAPREGKTLVWKNVNMTLVRIATRKGFCLPHHTWYLSFILYFAGWKRR